MFARMAKPNAKSDAFTGFPPRASRGRAPSTKQPAAALPSSLRALKAAARIMLPFDARPRQAILLPTRQGIAMGGNVCKWHAPAISRPIVDGRQRGEIGLRVAGKYLVAFVLRKHGNFFR